MRLPSVFVLAGAAFLFTSSSPAGDKKKDPDQIGNRNVSGGINFYSIEKEIALGKQLAEEVRRQSKLLDDPTVGEYINRVGQNLVRNSDATVPFTFQVLEGDQLNAFAFPGGFVFVYTGLIEATETEAELAGAMAHEIAHVAARHFTRQATHSQIANYATLPLIFLGNGIGCYAIRQGAGLGVSLGLLSFQRKFESEADTLGIQYMYKAGYDPTASVDLFERILSMGNRRPGTITRVFNTHPVTEDRLVQTQKNIAEMLPSRGEYVVTTSEFSEVRARVKARYGRRRQDDPNRPRLRKAPSAAVPGEDPDERPTLKRGDLVE